MPPGAVREATYGPGPGSPAGRRDSRLDGVGKVGRVSAARLGGRGEGHPPVRGSRGSRCRDWSRWTSPPALGSVHSTPACHPGSTLAYWSSASARILAARAHRSSWWPSLKVITVRAVAAEIVHRLLHVFELVAENPHAPLHVLHPRGHCQRGERLCQLRRARVSLLSLLRPTERHPLVPDSTLGRFALSPLQPLLRTNRMPLHATAAGSTVWVGGGLPTRKPGTSSSTDAK